MGIAAISLIAGARAHHRQSKAQPVSKYKLNLVVLLIDLPSEMWHACGHRIILA